MVTVLDCLRYGQSPRAMRAWARVIVGDYGDRVLLDVLFKQYHFSAVVHCGALIEVAQSCVTLTRTMQIMSARRRLPVPCAWQVLPSLFIHQVVLCMACLPIFPLRNMPHLLP